MAPASAGGVNDFMFDTGINVGFEDVQRKMEVKIRQVFLKC
jgi:hypothetical protein